MKCCEYDTRIFAPLGLTGQGQGSQLNAYKDFNLVSFISNFFLRRCLQDKIRQSVCHLRAFWG
jgi:hypothetical protein